MRVLENNSIRRDTVFEYYLDFGLLDMVKMVKAWEVECHQVCDITQEISENAK